MKEPDKHHRITFESPDHEVWRSSLENEFRKLMVEKEQGKPGIYPLSFMAFIEDELNVVERRLLQVDREIDNYHDPIVDSQGLDGLLSLKRTNENYSAFLKNEINRHKEKKSPKATKSLTHIERYTMLDILGLFKSEHWRNYTKQFQIEILSEILYCDSTTAKNLLNGRPNYVLKRDKKELLEQRMKENS